MSKSFARAKAEAEAAVLGTPLPSTRKENPRHIEDDEQELVFKWAHGTKARPGADVIYPELKLLHAIPNGGKRSQFEAERLRRQGTKAGVPDLDLPIRRATWIEDESVSTESIKVWYTTPYIGLRIEMKRPIVKGERKPEVSTEQKWWLTELQKQGHCCCVCYGSSEAVNAIEAYLTGKPVPHQWEPKP